VHTCLCLCALRQPTPRSPPFPYTTLFRSCDHGGIGAREAARRARSHRRSLARGARPATRANDARRAPLSIVRWRGDLSLQADARSEEHTSELLSLAYLVCRLLLENKKEKQ